VAVSRNKKAAVNYSSGDREHTCLLLVEGVAEEFSSSVSLILWAAIDLFAFWREAVSWPQPAWISTPTGHHDREREMRRCGERSFTFFHSAGDGNGIRSLDEEGNSEHGDGGEQETLTRICMKVSTSLLFVGCPE
jgi:hypothetical protein